MSEKLPKNYDFAEDLPPQCPPDTAIPPKEALLIRLWKNGTPTMAAFASHAARKLPIRGDTTPCKHASCSLFEHDVEGEQLNAMRALPHFRNFTHAFMLKVKPDSGMAEYGAKKHVDFWMFSSFNPVAAVDSVVPM